MSTAPAASIRPRRRGRAFALGALAVLLALALAAGGLVALLWHSESGTHWALQRVPGLQVEGAQGRLLGGPFQASSLQWQGGGWRIVVEDLSWRDSAWRWRPWQGAWVGVTLTAARARSVIATPLQETPTREPPDSLRLPLELAARDLHIDTLQIADMPLITMLGADIHLGAAQGTVHRVPRITLVLGNIAAHGEGSVATEGEMAVQAKLSLAGGEATRRPWRAQSALTGPLRRLAVEASLSVPPGASADATAVLAPFAPFPLAALNLRTESLDLSALGPALPETRLSGNAVLRETETRMQTVTGMPPVFDVQIDNALPGPWNAARLPLRHARVVLRPLADNPTAFVFESLNARLGGARPGGQIHGSGRLSAGTLALELRLDGLQPARLDTRAPALQLSGPLALTLRGLPASGAAAPPPGLAGELRTALEGGSLGQDRARATISAQADFALPGDGSLQVTLNQFRVASGSATASASAQGRLNADGAWQLATRGDLTRFDPGAWWPAAAARNNALNGRWKADLRGSTVAAASLWDTLRGEATLELAASRYAGVPLQGGATLHTRDNALLMHAELRAAGNRARVEGNVGVANRTPRWRLDIEAPALDALAPLAAVLPGAAPWMPRAGTLQAHAEAEGRWPAFASRGTLHAAGLQSQALHLARADGRWSLGGASADAPLTLQLDAAGLVQGQRRIDTLQVRADGTLREHHATLFASSPLRPPAWTDTLAAGVTPAGSVLRMSVDGRWQPGPGRGGLWQGRVGELRAAPPDRPDSPWLAARDLQFTAEVTSSGRLNSAKLAPGRLALFNGNVRWRQATWQGATPGTAAGYRIDAEIEPLQVAPLLARLQPSFAWQGDLAVGAHMQISAGSAFDADIVVKREGGDLSLTYQGVRQVLGLNELQMALAAHGGRWQLTQALSARNVGVLNGGLTIHATRGARWPAAAAPIEGGLSLRIDDLGVWAPWLPAGWRLGGQMQAVTTLAGTAGDPQASGRLTGAKLVLRNLFQGAHLRDGELAVALQGREAVVERLVFHGGGEGTLSVNGRATLTHAAPRAELRIAADRFRALDRVDRRITVSGSADLALQDKHLRLGGRFEVDEGLIDFSQAETPRNESDVIVVNRPGARTLPKDQPGLFAQTEVQLAIDLGEKLRLRGGGLDTLLRGQLRVTTRPSGDLHVAGVVRTVEGTYSAYGQRLAIERGELAFTGDVANPQLDVIAVRPGLDTQRVGVVVTGQAVNPRVRLYSAPNLPEFEALAWLVLGREPGALGREDTALLQRAALALLAGDQSGTGPGLVQRLGLDELSFSAGAGGNLSEGIVSLGKQVSNRLYVGYEHALAAAGGTWQLVYRIAGRFTVRLQAGEDQSLDAIWTWRWE